MATSQSKVFFHFSYDFLVGTIGNNKNKTNLKHRINLFQLQDSWIQFLNVFGSDRIVIVSNSTGTKDDPDYKQVNVQINEFFLSFFPSSRP